MSVVAASRLERMQNWVMEHKVLTSVIVLACGTVVYKGYQKSRSARKTRRAKRARNGGRTEVVVIAGSAALPLTRSLALDMERRGFIVYIICNAAEDESTVSSLSRQDIRPLTINTTDVRPTLLTQVLPQHANRLLCSLPKPVQLSSALPSTSSLPSRRDQTSSRTN